MTGLATPTSVLRWDPHSMNMPAAICDWVTPIAVTVFDDLSRRANCWRAIRHLLHDVMQADSVRL